MATKTIAAREIAGVKSNTEPIGDPQPPPASGLPDPQPLPMPPSVVPPKSIFMKLIAILAEVGNVEKKGYNKAQSYNFMRETDLVDKIRPVMAREHLFLHQTVIEQKITEVGETKSGSHNRLVEVVMRFTWVDADTGESWHVPADFPGHGMDTGDKGIYKAMTGAEKYFLMKTFLVSTGDDPEGDEKTDRQEAAAEAETGTRVAGRKRSAGQEKGGKSTVPTGPQIRELWRLFQAAGMVATDVVAFVERTLKVSGKHIDPAEKGAMLNWVQSLTGAQVGILIRTLSESTGDTGEPESGSDTETSSGSPGAEVGEDLSDETSPPPPVDKERAGLDI